MGSSQSVSKLPSSSSQSDQQQEFKKETLNPDNDITSNTTTTTATTTSTTKTKKTNDGSSLTGGIALIEYKCRKKKRVWGICVKEHYEQKFLPGKSLEPTEADCDDLFERYRRCYMRGILKQRQEERGIMDPPKEGTLLHQFMEEEGMLESNLHTTDKK
jgi:hypothetical protein